MTKRILTPVCSALTTLAVTVTSASPAFADPSELPSFRMGIQMIDGGSSVGGMEFTPYVSFGGGCSPWAGDTDTYDPDGARIALEPAPRGTIGNRDFRVGAQATDGNGSGTGPLQWSPWASQGGGVTEYAFDTDAYDPDQFRVCVEVRPMPADITINDVRLSIKIVDGGGADQGGLRRFTPWDSAGGGWSEYAYDTDAYDPDGFAVGLEVF